ncbi:MAG: hypothetical protein JO370_12330 [Paucibacter sp.]|nr:hypothetical protein [Roseateles sp.]
MLINKESDPSIDDVIILEGIQGLPLQNVVNYDTDSREATIEQQLGYVQNNPLLPMQYGYSQVAYPNSIVTDAKTGRRLQFNAPPTE